MATRLIDLSHEIEAGLVTYPGLPAPVVSDFNLCNLHLPPPAGFRLHCVPVKFRGVGTFPVRAYAVVG